jgi:hypothetical protein
MSTNFQDLTTTKLGSAAESMLIAEFAKSKNYYPYTPAIDASHPIDCLMLSGTSIWMLDLKCKSRRKYFADTGFDTADVEKYSTYPFPVYILWADIVQRKIYGNWLKKLLPYKKVDGVITYFPLDMMIEYRDMTDYEYEQLKKLEQSKYYK